MISNDPRGCGCPDCTGESDLCPSTERNPVAASDHDLSVLATASAVRAWLEGHPLIYREGLADILDDLGSLSGAELSAYYHLGLIGHDLAAPKSARLTPLGEQVRDYLRVSHG